MYCCIGVYCEKSLDCSDIAFEALVSIGESAGSCTCPFKQHIPKHFQAHVDLLSFHSQNT